MQRNAIEAARRRKNKSHTNTGASVEGFDHRIANRVTVKRTRGIRGQESAENSLKVHSGCIMGRITMSKILCALFGLCAYLVVVAAQCPRCAGDTNSIEDLPEGDRNDPRFFCKYYSQIRGGACFSSQNDVSRIPRSCLVSPSRQVDTSHPLFDVFSQGIIGVIRCTPEENPARNPCGCKEPCQTIRGNYICYVRDPQRCSIATRSNARPGEKWLRCKGGPTPPPPPPPQVEPTEPDELSVTITNIKSEEEKKDEQMREESTKKAVENAERYGTCSAKGQAASNGGSDEGLDWIGEICNAGGEAIGKLCDQSIPWPKSVQENVQETVKKCDLGDVLTSIGRAKKCFNEVKNVVKEIVRWDDLSICDLPIPGLQSLDLRSLVDSAKGLCVCLEDFKAFMQKYGRKLQQEGADATSLGGKGIELAADVAACLIKNNPNYEYKSKQEEVMNKLPQDAFIIKGPPVDLSMYLEILTIPFSGGETAKMVLINYWNNMKDRLHEGVMSFFQTKLLGPLGPLMNSFKALAQDDTPIEDRFERCFRGAQKKFDAKLSKTVKDFQDNLKTIQSFEKELEETYNDVETSLKAMDFSWDSALQLTGLSPQEMAEKMVVDGEWDAPIKAVLDAPNAIKSKVDRMVNLLNGDLMTRVKQATTSLTANAKSINDLLKQLPTEGKDSCNLGPLGDVIKAFADGSIQETLKQVGKIKLSTKMFKPDVVSYSHKIKFGEMDMPCYKGMESYKKKPLPTVHYPKFSRCTQSVSLPLPNGHIPILEIRA